MGSRAHPRNRRVPAGLREFLEEAKPEEIRLLGDMLSEWRNWSGSLRAGNFFRAVAEGVLTQNTEAHLRRWLKAEAKLRSAGATLNRNSPPPRSGAVRRDRQKVQF